MKRLVSVLVLLAVVCPTFAQSDSLLNVLNRTPEEQRIPVYQSLITSLWLNHPDSAMIYARQALALAERLDDDQARAITTRLIGGAYYYQGDYDSTIWYSHRAYSLSQKVNDSTLMTSCLNNLGLSYYSVGSYPEALEYLLRSLNLKRRLRQEYGMTQTLNNVGLVYLELKDFNRAQSFFEAALAKAYDEGDKHIQLYSLNNLGLTFFRQQDFAKAIESYKRALNIASRIDNVVWHSAACSGLGDVYFEQGKIAEAKHLYQRSLMLSSRISEKSGLAAVYASLSAVSARESKIDSAFYLLRMSQRISTAIKARDQVIENYKSFHDLYVQMERYDSALYYQSRYIDLRDSLFNENLARNIGDIQLKIQEEESQHQLADKDAVIRRIRWQAYLLFGAALLIALFAFFYYRSFRRQRTLAADLKKKNDEVTAQAEEIHAQKEALQLSHGQLERAQEKIRDQNKRLQELNRQLQTTVDERTRELARANSELNLVNLEMDNFIYKSSHDIKGPLVRLLGVCHVAMLDVKDETARQYFQMLYVTAQHLNDIFDRLRTVSDINNRPAVSEPVDFDKILSNVSRGLRDLEGFREVSIIPAIDPQTSMHSDPFLLEIIFHNMIENAVRFRNPSPQKEKTIHIDVTRQNGDLRISFKDNGIGIKPDDVEHLFNMFSSAALAHQTVGLGLYIVKQCVSKLNGSVQFIPSNQQTQFEIVLPVS
jgi:signal transduction histidine kinase/tetratricopeptide (TPR) repeat protein